jgi:dephospho-CoA kinase/membrane-associated phospholipid phosphatase
MERRDWLLAGVIVGSALFVLLAMDQVLHGPVYTIDFPVDAEMTRLNATGWPIHVVGNWMSLAGSTTIDAPALVVATVVLWVWGQRRLAAWCLGAGALTGLLNVWLKAYFQRPLPPFIYDRFKSFAFPSGHTMGAAGTLGIALLLLAEGHVARHGLVGPAARRVRLRALAAWGAVSLVVGVGRVLAQHHWVSDVLGAWAVSAALVCGTVLASAWRPGRRGAARPGALEAAGGGSAVGEGMRAIGFTGMPGSGKSEAMEVAKARGHPVVRMGDLIWEEVERQGLPRDARHVGEVATAMRERHGKDVWSRRTVERVREVLRERHASVVLIDGIRSHEEVETFRQELGSSFVLVAIHTDPEHRFQRMVRRARADDSPDVGVLKARDEREMGWGIARTIALADEMVVNDGSLEQFRARVAALLDRVAKA